MSEHHLDNAVRKIQAYLYLYYMFAVPHTVGFFQMPVFGVSRPVEAMLSGWDMANSGCLQCRLCMISAAHVHPSQSPINYWSVVRLKNLVIQESPGMLCCRFQHTLEGRLQCNRYSSNSSRYMFALGCALPIYDESCCLKLKSC